MRLRSKTVLAATVKAGQRKAEKRKTPPTSTDEDKIQRPSDTCASCTNGKRSPKRGRGRHHPQKIQRSPRIIIDEAANEAMELDQVPDEASTTDDNTIHNKNAEPPHRRRGRPRVRPLPPPSQPTSESASAADSASMLSSNPVSATDVTVKLNGVKSLKTNLTPCTSIIMSAPALEKQENYTGKISVDVQSTCCTDEAKQPTNTTDVLQMDTTPARRPRGRPRKANQQPSLVMSNASSNIAMTTTTQTSNTTTTAKRVRRPRLWSCCEPIPHKNSTVERAASCPPVITTIHQHQPCSLPATALELTAEADTVTQTITTTPPKRKRGRPRVRSSYKPTPPSKPEIGFERTITTTPPKRKRGRPRVRSSYEPTPPSKLEIAVERATSNTPTSPSTWSGRLRSSSRTSTTSSSVISVTSDVSLASSEATVHSDKALITNISNDLMEENMSVTGSTSAAIQRKRGRPRVRPVKKSQVSEESTSSAEFIINVPLTNSFASLELTQSDEKMEANELSDEELIMNVVYDVDSSSGKPSQPANADIRRPFICVATGTTNQADPRKFPVMTNVQCVSMSTCAALSSAINGRLIFSTNDIDTVLEYGDRLNKAIPTHLREHGTNFISAEDLPHQIQLPLQTVTIEPPQFLEQGLYENSKLETVSTLHRFLNEGVFATQHRYPNRVHHDLDSYLFTGLGYTVAFWHTPQEGYYLYNSHSVDSENRATGHDVGKARLFKCRTMLDLAQLLVTHHISGQRYDIHRLRLTQNIRDNIRFVQNAPPNTPSVTPESIKSSFKKPVGRPQKLKPGNTQIIENSPQNSRSRYNKSNPDIGRKATQKYYKENANVYKQTKQTYRKVNKTNISKVNKQYYESHPISQTIKSTHIAELSGVNLNKIQIFNLKKTSLLTSNIHKCTHCNAALFHEEIEGRVGRSKWCCGLGSYVTYFPPINEAFYSDSTFIQDSRAYNNLFAFSALGINNSYQTPSPFFVKIQGRTYHKVMNLSHRPRDSHNPIGLYLDDGEERNRLATNRRLDRNILTSIRYYLDEVNPFIDVFKRLHLEESDTAHLVFEPTSRSTHGNILGDRPCGRELAAFISTEVEEFVPRQVVIWKLGDYQTRTISIFHECYEAFQYPLLFPHGTIGWFLGKLDKVGKKLSQVNYYRCLLLSENRFSQLGRLSEEWLVDMFCRMEEERLRFIKNAQTSNSNPLRSAPLNELQDANEGRELSNLHNDETIQGESDTTRLGRIFLPNSFTNSPRYMKSHYMDAMAIVSRLGNPTYFVTITCNKYWPEILQSTPPGSKPSAVIMCRVFHLKLKQLLNDIRNGWFGRLVYFIYTIEFQKRGLPHCHLVFRVADGPIQASEIDKVVRADIPSADEANGVLRDSVLRHMIHGPCIDSELPCWNRDKRVCTRYFPKQSSDFTYIDQKGFIHLRRDGNNVHVMKRHNGPERPVNDCWVVPYNAALLLKYNCHINIEIASTRKVVKYLFKYITKGPDHARVAVVADADAHNEIEQYVTKRYVGACDAAWRILEFPITNRDPSVMQLPVHLLDRQMVFFRSSTLASAVHNTSSLLLTYFGRPMSSEFNRLTYREFFELYRVLSRLEVEKYNTRLQRPTLNSSQISVPVLETSNGCFIKRRERGRMVCRMYWVPPNRGELFYLRLLLLDRACRGYDDLYALGGPDCHSFQEAARVLGLANDELEYASALEEASTFCTGHRLRHFFVLLASNGAPARILWDQFRDSICEDFIERLGADQKEEAYVECLRLIGRMLIRQGTSLVEQGLPDVPDNTTELGRELVGYDRVMLVDFVEEWLPRLSFDQREVYDSVVDLIETGPPTAGACAAIFVDGPAGTGKTLLLNLLAAHFRGEGKVVLCTASSGIAAQNYHNGTTAHSMFRLPLHFNADDTSLWSITNGSQRADLIRSSSLIIYDEAPMAHKFLIHILDRSLRDLMGVNVPFGGKVIVFSGDFRQIPPVVLTAKTPLDVISASLKSSPLWPHLRKFNLITSHRARDDLTYADFLLRIGNATISKHLLVTARGDETLVCLDNVDFVANLEELIHSVYPHDLLDNPDVCATRSIMSTHNINVRQINSIILDQLPGEMLHFTSIDYPTTPEAGDNVLGVEYLHSVSVPGTPDHILDLKIGAVCMVIRNISFTDGLVNGTKVIIVDASPRLIKVRKPDELDEQKYLFIPRIVFKIPVERNSHIEMCRRQFPLQVCYAMSIHKSQGQTLSMVGVDLRSSSFAHGQLYVALSRVRNSNNIKILVSENYIRNNRCFTNNIVYPQLL